MDKNEHAYVKLQRHLDSQAIGFPAMRSGVEIRILKHIFTPLEAELAACLSHKAEPPEKIFERANHLTDSVKTLAETLDGIEKKGGIGTRVQAGKTLYYNIPFAVGMYESQKNRLTLEFIEDVDKYMSSANFGIGFLSVVPSQMRTIPIEKTIHPKHNVATFDEATAILRGSDGPFVVVDCICRKIKSLKGDPCKITDRKETCLAVGDTAEFSIRSGIANREITLEESISILEQNQKQGLVLQPSNTQSAEFICSCCKCCCGWLETFRKLPKPIDFWTSNFYAVLDADACDGCKKCEKRCPLDAVFEKKGKKSINLNKCIGCGVCVADCPQKAVSLKKKTVEVIPPQTQDELYEKIMSNRKRRLIKLKFIAKLVIDSVSSALSRRFKW